MSDIYRGWGIRQAISHSIRYPLNRLGRSAEERAVVQLADSVAEMLHRLDVDSEEGRKRLAGEMARRVIDACFEDAVDPSDITSLDFYQHLAAFCHAIIEFEALFELPKALTHHRSEKPSLLGSLLARPTISRSELWEIEDALKQTDRILSDFDQSMGELTLWVLHVVSPLVDTCPQLLEQKEGSAKQLGHDLMLSAPLSMLLNDMGDYVERLMMLPHAPEFNEVGTTKHIRE